MRIRSSLLFIIVSVLVLAGCSARYQPQKLQYSQYRITPQQAPDSGLLVMLSPYRDSVNRSMNDVLATLEVALEKKQPEGPLGNLLADALLTMAREKFATRVDAAVINYGGIRITQVAAGPMTRGKVFELMPFDNLLILQKLPGSVLQQFLDLTAARGGWPFAGITYVIRDKKATEVRVGGEPLDPAREYVLANSDYVANGGDNADMLRPIPQITNGYLMRDAIIDYLIQFTKSGRPVPPPSAQRITNAQ